MDSDRCLRCLDGRPQTSNSERYFCDCDGWTVDDDELDFRVAVSESESEEISTVGKYSTSSEKGVVGDVRGDESEDETLMDKAGGEEVGEGNGEEHGDDAEDGGIERDFSLRSISRALEADRKGVALSSSSTGGGVSSSTSSEGIWRICLRLDFAGDGADFLWLLPRS